MRHAGKLIFSLLVFFALPALWASGVKAAGPVPAEDPVTGELLIYSVINENATKALAELFTRKTGVKVDSFRAATGELVNRVIAEKDAPQADLFLGGAESQHIAIAKAGALDNYNSAAVPGIPAYTRAEDGTWTGFCVLTLGIGVNERRFKEKFPGKAYPQTWDELNDPAFKGELVFNDPAASSTGYLFLQSQLQRLGETRGWDYLKSLAALAGQFPPSGSAPPRLIGTGEYSICVAYVHAMQTYAAQGHPVKILVPPKTVGEIDAVSVIKGGPNRLNARKFVDFMLSREAQELFLSFSPAIPVNPEAKQPEGSISIDKLDLLDYDSELAGSRRDAALARWQQEVK
ncbi:MAG: ABC transporter substrate-binding protein [Treponema sp.]|jgi:iron(III) transport system substrate-binding protein|nr:ABC transporter substrate-binding protein [Treponema sp.]